jgi:hypothetical protein
MSPPIADARSAPSRSRHRHSLGSSLRLAYYTRTLTSTQVENQLFERHSTGTGIALALEIDRRSIAGKNSDAHRMSRRRVE